MTAEPPSPPRPTEPDWQAITATLVEALRLTREFVGEPLLPAVPGWSWFDATNLYREAAGLPPLPRAPTLPRPTRR